MGEGAVPEIRSGGAPAVTDAERDAALAHLRTLVAAGTLDLDRFSSGLDRVLAARTLDELADALRDVPAPVRITPPDRWLAEPLELQTRSGKLELVASWQLARDTRVSCTSGKVVLDLTAAEFDGRLIDLDLSARSGRIEVIVPAGVEVQFAEASGTSGKIDNDLGPVVALPGAPLIRLRARTTSGVIRLSRPAPPRAQRRRRRWWWPFGRR